MPKKLLKEVQDYKFFRDDLGIAMPFERLNKKRVDSRIFRRFTNFNFKRKKNINSNINLNDIDLLYKRNYNKSAVTYNITELLFR